MIELLYNADEILNVFVGHVILNMMHRSYLKF